MRMQGAVLCAVCLHSCFTMGTVRKAEFLWVKKQGERLPCLWRRMMQMYAVPKSQVNSSELNKKGSYTSNNHRVRCMSLFIYLRNRAENTEKYSVYCNWMRMLLKYMCVVITAYERKRILHLLLSCPWGIRRTWNNVHDGENNIELWRNSWYTKEDWKYIHSDFKGNMIDEDFRNHPYAQCTTRNS